MSTDIQTALNQTCATEGVVYRRVPSDGRWHLADLANDARGKGDGRIRIFPDGQGGIVANNKAGTTKTFFVDSQRSLSASEQIERQRIAAELRANSEREQAKREARASERARVIFDEKPCPSEHPYLVRKGVPTHPDLCQMDGPDPWGRVGSILVPMRLSPYGFIQSLQFISTSGDKRFLSGGRKKGCFFELSQCTKPEAAAFICEGLATGLTIQQATGQTVFIGFDAGNLEPVARNLRQWYPSHQFIIAADNDCQTIGNPGLSYAKKAAAAIGARVMLPPCDDGKARDWNDYAAEFGL